MNWNVPLLIAFICSCSEQKRTTANDDFITTPSGLKYQVLEKGKGALAKEGNEVLIFETTTYLDGTVLYSNENTGKPVKVLIGGNQATAGVDEGLRGMQVGEVRKLVLPPHLSRRTSYPPNVSPDSTIVVKVLLSEIVEK
jgi:FKBP-type peptidyl-prolyl cis-trans isomerase